MNHQAAENVFLELFERALDIFLLIGKLRQGLRHHFALHFGDALVAFELFGNFQRLLELGHGQLFDPLAHRVVQLGQRHMALGFADRLAKLFLDLQQRLDRIMTGEQRFENLFFRNDLRAALDHDDGVLAAGQKNIGVAVCQLRFGSGSSPTGRRCGRCARRRAGH